MGGELLLRFVLGGAIVSLFALAGELFKPKTFAGLFGAAPSVAIATLSLAFAKQSAGYVSMEARSMLVGCLALFCYSVLCAVLATRRPVPVWLGAALAWAGWMAVALGTLAALGLMRADG